MEISKINVNGNSYDINDNRLSSSDITNIGKINATDIANMLDAAEYVPSASEGGSDTTYQITINGTTAGDSTNGTNLGSIYAPTTAGIQGQALISNGSGAPTWGTVSASTSYPNVTYTVTTKTNSSSSITDLDATVADVCLITTSANISSLRFTAGKAPAIGHSYHVIVKSNGTTERTVALTAGRVSDSNVTGSYMYYICPTTSGISTKTKWVSTLSTNATSCSYAELDFLRVDETTIYVRGV